LSIRPGQRSRLFRPRRAASFNGLRLAAQIFVSAAREKPLARRRDSPK
jgi:hypothetical protein